MAKTLLQQSEAVLKKHLALGTSRQQASNVGNTNYQSFTSVRSFKDTASTLARVASHLGVNKLRDITLAQANNYLESRREQLSKRTPFAHVQKQSGMISQKTLDSERKALSLLLNENIARVYTPVTSNANSRAYTHDQVEAIKRAQSERNSISTQIAHESGLRASELFTIRRADEMEITHTRVWHKDRFVGMEGTRYIVKGKGGLIREVILSNETAQKLESYRLDEPIERKDRGVNYQSYYDIGAGNAFSSSFSDSSNRSLGFSNGAHGLRHQYAQNRLNEIKQLGYSDKEARLILSQELGHFRASITHVYLR